MRLKFMFSVLILATAVFLISCNGVDNLANNNSAKPENRNTGPEITYPDGVNRITTDELAEMMKNDEVLVVDVRTQASYDLGHIPGSRLIPTDQIGNHVNELPRDKLIVTYCS